MRIVSIDPLVASDAECRDWCAVEAAQQARWAPLGLVPPDDVLLAVARARRPDLGKGFLLAYDGDGAAVGGTETSWPVAYDNLHRYDGHAEPVVAGDRDVIAALLREMAAEAAALGRTVLGIEAFEGGGTSALLASLPLGVAAVGSREQHNVVDLATVSRSAVAALVDEARAASGGYDVVAWDGPVPDELVEQLAAVSGSMNDAPRDDLALEDFVHSPERIRLHEAYVSTWATSWSVAARHRASGALVAHTEIAAAHGFPEVQQQENTVVVPAHRGHRLGLLLKGLNQLRIIDERPEARAISTWNAVTNDPMIRVNRALGYACQNVCEEWETTPAALLEALG